MLLKLSADIAECYQHAEDCARRAKDERDALRDDWLAMERRRISLARSYELSERIERFQPKRPK